MKRLLTIGISLIGLAGPVAAQNLVPLADETAQPAPAWDARQFIIKNHVHQISGITTLALATLTGAAGITLASGVEWSGLEQTHGILGLSTMAAGAATLGLGLTAYSDRLDEVWPHALFMGIAETGFVLNAFVLKPGSLPHKVTGVTAVSSLLAGLVSIIVITSN